MRTSSGVHGQKLGLLLCFMASWSAVGCCVTGGWIMNNSGMGYYQQGNYGMARHEFAQAVAMDPCNPDYRHNLAMALQRSGNSQHAEQILRHNLTVDAMHQQTYHSLAKLMLETGRQPEADEILTTWAATQPYNPTAHLELAWLQRETGNLPAAESSLRQALQMDPRNPIAIAHLGQIYQDAGDTSRAAALYQQSLSLNYGQPEVQSRLASLQGSPTGRLSPNGAMMAPTSNNLALAAGAPMMYQSPSSLTPIPMPQGTMPGMPAHGAPMNSYAASYGGIPAGTVQVTPWQPVPASTAWNSGTAPTPIAVGAGSLAVQAPTTVMKVSAETAAGMPSLPGVVDGPTHANFVAPTTASTTVPHAAPALLPTSTVPPVSLEAWQPAVPAGAPVVIQSSDPAQFSEMANDLPTVEPY